MAGLRIICSAIPSLNGVGHNDVDWTLLGQVEFGRVELCMLAVTARLCHSQDLHITLCGFSCLSKTYLGNK